MKNKFLLLTWLLALPLLWAGCDKPLFQPDKDDTEEPEELPPITTTGENTFGCLVNGEVWLPAGPDRYNRGFDENTGYFLFWATRRFSNSKDFERIGISGKYTPNSTKISELRITYSSNNPELTLYESDSSSANANLHYINIDGNIASGTFEATVINESSPFDTVSLTQGRFDFNY